MGNPAQQATGSSLSRRCLRCQLELEPYEADWQEKCSCKAALAVCRLNVGPLTEVQPAAAARHASMSSAFTLRKHGVMLEFHVAAETRAWWLISLHLCCARAAYRPQATGADTSAAQPAGAAAPASTRQQQHPGPETRVFKAAAFTQRDPCPSSLHRLSSIGADWQWQHATQFPSPHPTRHATHNQCPHAPLSPLSLSIFANHHVPPRSPVPPLQEKNIKHNGNLTLDDIYEVARVMRDRSCAASFAGTVKEMLGTCVSGERRGEACAGAARPHARAVGTHPWAVGGQGWAGGSSVGCLIAGHWAPWLA
ncbi:hypothetical protein ABPG77_011411 [Micractinium sp. CCAP 211/92]